MDPVFDFGNSIVRRAKTVNAKRQSRKEGPIIAFFDFDNTLIHDDSQGLEIGFLMDRRKIRLLDLVRIGLHHWLFKRHLASSEQMVRTCIRIYRSLSPEALGLQTAGFHQECIRPRYAPAVRQRFARHLEDGHVCVIISASVPHLLRPAAQELGAHHLICTRLETDGAGKFTGRPRGPVCVGAEKTQQALELAAEHGTDLSRAWAYSDHHADLDFLCAVGRPVAVTPTPHLRRIANRKRWPILATS